MRQAGVIANDADAERFAAYLLTLGIKCQVDSEGVGWAIWIRDEDHLHRARLELAAFLLAPLDSKYRGAETAASALMREEQRLWEERRRNVRDVKGQWGRRPARRAPFVMVLIGLSLLVFVLSDMGEVSTGLNGAMEHLLFCRVRLTPGGIVAPKDGLEQIKQGEIWRLITPIFIHFGLLHLVMNMQALYVLGGAIEERKGTVYLAVIVFSIAIASNVLQYYGTSLWSSGTPNPLFGGISGVVFGLFGYIWMKSWYDPQSGLSLPPSSIVVCLLFYALCVLRDLPQLADTLGRTLPHVANTAHTVGLVMGAVIGYVSSMRSGRRS